MKMPSLEAVKRWEMWEHLGKLSSRHRSDRLCTAFAEPEDGGGAPNLFQPAPAVQLTEVQVETGEKKVK